MKYVQTSSLSTDHIGNPRHLLHEYRVAGGRLFVGVDHLLGSAAAPSLLFVPDPVPADSADHEAP